MKTGGNTSVCGKAVILVVLLCLFHVLESEAQTDGKCGIANRHWAGSLCTITTAKWGFPGIGTNKLVNASDSRTDVLTKGYDEWDKSDDGWTLKVYPIKYQDEKKAEKYLFGWFHITLEGSSSARSADIIIIEAHVEHVYQAPAGAFVRKKTKCGSSSGTTDKSNYIPCNFAQDPMPFTGNMYAQVVAPGKGPRKFQWIYQTFLPWCDILNEKNGLYFRVHIIGQRGSSNMVGLSLVKQSHIYFDPARVYGAGAIDPFPSKRAQDTFTCATVADAGNPPWILKATGSNLTQFTQPYSRCVTFSCDYLITYESRCGRQTQNAFSTNYYFQHVCRESDFNLTGSDRGLPDIFDDYYAQMVNVTFNCSNSCNETVRMRQKYGEEASSVIGKFIWGARKAHGVSMCVSFFFVYPIISFVARYYKETFMKFRVVVNVHVWYAVHVYGSLVLLALLISGLGMAVHGRLFYGYSRSSVGIIHCQLGWAAAGSCALGFLSNGLRCKSVGTRKICIFIHFLSGFLYHVTSMLCMFTSVYIPGSPTGTAQIDLDQLKIGSPIIILILLWVLFEGYANVVTLTLVKKADSYTFMNPKRTWVFGFIGTPSLQSEATKDFKDGYERMQQLKRFTIVSGIVTILALLLVSYPSSSGRYFGNMEFTHWPNGSLRFSQLFEEYAAFL